MNIIRLIKNNIVVTSKNTIIVYNCEDETTKIIEIPDVVAPSNLAKSSEVFLAENKTIICMRASDDEHFIAVCLKNKQLVVYNHEFNVVKNVLTKRVTSSVRFWHNEDLVVADKTGDVFVYKVSSESVVNSILGHFSMLLDVAISNNGKYIITCDRDEKIRVSSYPNAYNIVSFCLGHREFVTKIEVLDDMLVSASGDGTVRFWNYLTGQQINMINTNEYVKDESVEKFCNTLDKDKVEVSALPVTDLQIFKSDRFIIGVTLFGLQELQLYQMNTVNGKVEVEFLQTINVNSIVLSFSLSEKLFILTKNELLVYCLTDNGYKKRIVQKFDILFDNLKDKLYEITDIDVCNLYKRKYDNVQEYLERKKLRLECTTSN